MQYCIFLVKFVNLILFLLFATGCTCLVNKDFERQTGLTCVNGTLLPLLLLLHSHPKLSWHTDFWEYGIHPEWLNVICGNLKSKLETFVWNRWKFSASGCIICLHHRIGRGIIAFSRVSLSLNVLHFTQYKLAHLLLHQLYAVVADYINAFVE